MLALINGKLFDGSGAVIENGAVLIENGCIAAAGDSVVIPEGCAVKDMEGRSIIPALIDMHTHFSGTSELKPWEPGKRDNTDDYREARDGFERWGVCCARTCGDICPDIIDFRDSGIGSVHIAAAGKWIQGKGAHPTYTLYGAHPEILENGCICVDDESDLEAAVRAIKESGADWLKLFYASSPFFFFGAPNKKMSENCLRRLTELGHKTGLKVMVHVDGAGDMRAAAMAGADSVEHALGVGSPDDGYDETLFELLKEKRVAVVPTVIVARDFAGGNEPVGKETYAKLLDIVGAMHRSGVTICAGCDSGIPFVPFGESLHEELRCLTEAGFSPAEAISAATGVSAGVLGMEDIGGIAPGKAAQLLILDGDPEKDIGATKRIWAYVRGGEFIPA